ncbi:aa3-type cytochrome oxidase subunit CtaJ [Micromonosporaceae bacterium Da 78-11]
MIIPVGVIALVASLVLSGSDRSKRTPRYRPGRQYDFQPIWFLASPEQVSPVGAGLSLGGSAGHAPALEATVYEDASGARVLPGPTGGASDSW